MILQDTFINYFLINNTYYGSIKIKDLIGNHIVIPNIQRIIDDSKVNEIIKYQCEYYKKNNKFNIIGVINFHYCNDNKLLYLTDGQHRFFAIKNMYEKMGHNITVPIECIIIDTYNDVKDNFKIINKNTLLPEFPDNIDKNIPELAAIYFKNKYDIWSKNSRARRPHLYFNFFQESLGFLTEKLDIDSSEKLIEIVEEYNRKLSQWNIEQFPDKKNLNENIIKKCKEVGFYLGLYKHISDNFGYKWCQDIIKLESGIIVKDLKKNSKRKIPKSVKNNSWDIYIGKKIGQVFCICCNLNMIDSKTFTAGHIISEKNGGLINIDNILPICNTCNLSMGFSNMDDFIKKFYPNNFDNFKIRKYTTKKKTQMEFV